MIEKILSAYNLNRENFDIIRFGNGLINKTWRIKNSNHDYILQQINHEIFKKPDAIASNVRSISEYLKLKFPEYQFINTIKTTSNQDILHLKNHGYFRLSEYVKQSHTIDTVQESQQAFEASRKFGQFTKILSGFPLSELQITLPDFHNLTLRFSQFNLALKHGDQKRIHTSTDLINFLIDNREIVDIYEDILQNSNFKLRVTHHDTKISNVLFNNSNQGICIIDLDTVMPGYFISDVGDMIRTFLSPVNEEEKNFSKIEIRSEYFSAIFKGYMSEMKNEFSKQERDHFIYSGKFMIYMQAMRFLTDYCNNDTYYTAKYPDQNYVRAANQIVLYNRLVEKEDELKKIILELDK